MAQVKRRGSGVVGFAVEYDFDAADADDRGHHANIERLRFEHDALFDVQLQEDPDIIAPGLSKPVGIAADPAQGLTQGFATGLDKFMTPLTDMLTRLQAFRQASSP